MGLITILTEGGQTWAHRIRMAKQVLRLTFIVSFTMGLSIFLTPMTQQPLERYQAVWYLSKANIFQKTKKTILVSAKFWSKATRISHNGGSKALRVNTRRAARASKALVQQLLIHSMQALNKAVQGAILAFLGTLAFFFLKGVISRKKKHLSGKRLISPRLLAILLKVRRQNSKFKLGKLPLVKNSETQHMLVTGGTGSGKTNCFHTILPQIEKRGDRAVIVDTTGEFVERYYNPDKDTLLNPFDERSAQWLPWQECDTSFDYDALAESFIPLSYDEKEDYWRNAARSLFSSLLQITQEDANLSYFVQYLLYEPLEELSSILMNTKASAHISSSSDKTSASIRSVATSFLDCFEVLSSTKKPFSIKKWVQQEGSGRLFLQCSVAQRSTLNPLISAWFSIAMRSLLQMPRDLNRRLWFVADELASLNRLRDLETCLTESRKFGGCALLAVQSPSQLDQIYGRDATKVILGNCSTRVAFYEQDPEVAERISKIFGYKEIEERTEGISYGAHEMRDGVNLSSQKKRKPVVSPDELQNLKRNQAYIKLPGKMPLTKLSLSIV